MLQSLTPLRDVLADFGVGLSFDGRWLTPDTTGPCVMMFTDDVPEHVLTETDSRRILIATQPGSPQVCVEPHNPLVATHVVSVVGTRTFAGRTLLLSGAHALPTPPGAEVLAERQGSVYAYRNNYATWLGSFSPLTDEFLAASDNTEFLSLALFGAVRPEFVRRIHDYSSPVAHGSPRAVDLSGETWDLSGVPNTLDIQADDLDMVMRRCSRKLPELMHDELLSFADRPDATGAVLFKGVPVGTLPPTPESPTASTEKDCVSEMMLLAAGRALGQPVGYLPEHGGLVVQNLIPTRAGAYRQVSTSSAVTLAWHTEAAFHPHRPRYLLLLCLRGDPQARTTLASIREIVATLSLRTRHLLSQPMFRTAADESYVGSGSRRRGPRVSVLSGSFDSPRMVFDADLMVGLDDASQNALSELTSAIEDHHTGVVLEPGDLLVVDNSIAVHGRSPFTPRFDGTDRWLQRTFIIPDLAAAAGDLTGRVVRTLFAG
jgi:L-asparagine oxygenase